MTRPWKHPDSGYYWFRKRVPDDLRNSIGRGEAKFSLGTRDPIEAKRLHALKLAEVEERWANLRAGQRPLSPDDIAREAAAISNGLRRRLDADPYKSLAWDVDVGASIWMPIGRGGPYYTDVTQPLPPLESKKLDQQRICYALVDEHVSARGLTAQAPVSKIGGRRREVSGTRRGTASPARAKLLNEAVLENRSHAVGQSSDKRTLLRVGRGQPVGLYAPLHWRGCCAARPSTARLLWVGSHRSPRLLSVIKLSASIDAFRSRPLGLHCLASLKGGAHWGLAICVLCAAILGRIMWR